jgi:hypothetical protein
VRRPPGRRSPRHRPGARSGRPRRMSSSSMQGRSSWIRL